MPQDKNRVPSKKFYVPWYFLRALVPLLFLRALVLSCPCNFYVPSYPSALVPLKFLRVLVPSCFLREKNNNYLVAVEWPYIWKFILAKIFPIRLL